ncbi:WYL domain-containing protein [Geodermatophilus sp. YIM 151500]|uniref:helix-turn-helix transcriptional regulator n=1 Tax=Geodermatophilus sp. YIM 151500 TaxID=2984531 RepID=UPI0021E487A1|nr:WYL domain-containing protein [Geodermatophilus sp. YIM 151500]MCV2489725.1 WYL domain-containing protein [Geodermatophilus sp. YIM 151500]
MNRTDRLHALSEELRRAGSRGRTAARLAAWLEVSVRTVKRDVSALQQAGLPVWARSGPGGGYVLDAAATLPPVTLTPEQAAAIAVALATQPDGPFATDGRVALEKVLDVLDPGGRERVELLAQRVWVRTPAGQASGVRSVVEQGLSRRRVVVIGYRDGAGRVTRRRVEPQMLVRTGDHWYLIAWCLERDAPRWFRCDRVESAALTPEAAAERDPASFGTPPPDAHPVRPRRSPAHPAGRRLPGAAHPAGRRLTGAAGPAAAGTGSGADDDRGLAPVIHLRSAR